MIIIILNCIILNIFSRFSNYKANVLLVGLHENFLVESKLFRSITEATSIAEEFPSRKSRVSSTARSNYSIEEDLPSRKSTARTNYSIEEDLPSRKSTARTNYSIEEYLPSRKSTARSNYSIEEDIKSRKSTARTKYSEDFEEDLPPSSRKSRLSHSQRSVSTHLSGRSTSKGDKTPRLSVLLKILVV